MTTNEEYIRRNKVVTVDDDKNTRLHYAAALNNYEVVVEEIAKKQKTDPENYLGWTPLMMAVRNANMAIVTLLLENGANATKKNKYGINIFLISVTCGDLAIVEKILNHLLTGGISRQSMQKIFSPISLAIMFGHSHIFKHLLERSFDVNVATPLTGLTPLMFAAALGNHKAIKRLLHHNADPKIKNSLGKTAHEIIQSRHKTIEADPGKKLKSPNMPLIFISPPAMASPFLQLTPYGNLDGAPRKSSNVNTPQGMPTPGMPPITPQFAPQQVFFPPNFTPSHFISPSGYQSYGSDVFNSNISRISPFFSPFPHQMVHPGYV